MRLAGAHAGSGQINKRIDLVSRDAWKKSSEGGTYELVFGKYLSAQVACLGLYLPPILAFAQSSDVAQNLDACKTGRESRDRSKLSAARLADSFRHSAATIVNQKTENLKLVQNLLGHSNRGTTADVYTHTSADTDRTAALALENAIFGDLFQVVPRYGTRAAAN